MQPQVVDDVHEYTKGDPIPDDWYIWRDVKDEDIPTPFLGEHKDMKYAEVCDATDHHPTTSLHFHARLCPEDGESTPEKW